jgi:transposase-like protein
MVENDSELLKQLAICGKRYDKQAKQELVRVFQAGVSVGKLAYQHDVNANLRCKWIDQYRYKHAQEQAMSY